MLTFRRLTYLFFALLLVLNLYSIFGCGGEAGFLCANMPWFYAFLVIAYFGISVTFAFLLCSGFHFPVACHGSRESDLVALTFDDGPDSDRTPRVLDILKKHGVPATFFLVGKNIAGNEAILGRIEAEGHLIGTHSWSHSPWFDFYPPRRMKKELLRTADAVKTNTGKSPLIFRPPFGVMNPMLARALRDLPWTVAGWDTRSLDTVIKDPEKILKRITGMLKPGSVILLHDHTDFSSDYLERMILEVQRKGLRFSLLDKVLNIPGYE